VVAAHYTKDDLLNCWNSSSDISGYHAEFHEGHGTVGAGHGARHGMCELTARHGNAMGTAFYVSIGLYTTSEHGASNIITADAHTSAASSRQN